MFDECGMSENGIIIDPEYIQKYVHIPFSTEALDLKSSGLRNTDALVLTRFAQLDFVLYLCTQKLNNQRYEHKIYRQQCY